MPMAPSPRDRAATASPKQLLQRLPKFPIRLWIERGLILVAWANLLLVAFNMTYVPLRSFYLRAALVLRDMGPEYPWLTPLIGPPGLNTLPYDPIKGIEPERMTVRYLQTVDRLQEALFTGGIQSPEVPPILAELRQRSEEMILQNPFEIAERTGSLERIKNRVRERVGNDSAIAAFNEFWSVQYLSRSRWDRELAFFDQEIRFALQSNYFRSIGENGQPADYFAILDTPFIILFAIDFLFRTLSTKRRYRDLTWRAAALNNWSDLLFLLPFWRWLRIIPVVSRSNRANFPNLEPIRALISRSFAASLASELTEVVVLEMVNGFQRGVKSGALADQLLGATATTYVEINDVNEIQAIADRLVQLAVDRVLPELRPELEAFLAAQLEYTLQQLPAYQNFKGIPGLDALPHHLAQQAALALAIAATGAPRAAYASLTSPLAPSAEAHLDRLVAKGGDTFRAELGRKETLDELQKLVWDLLEELKLSYVRRARDTSDSLELLEESERLRIKAGKPRL